MKLIVLLALVAADVSAAGPACAPPCREGFTCLEGQCVSACNPPCPAGERCTGDGQCVPAAAGRLVPEEAPPPPPTPPSSGPAPQLVPAADGRIYALEQERIDVIASRRGFGLPIILTAIGLAVAAVGAFFMYAGAAALGRSSEPFIIGVACGVAALTPLILGTVFFFKVPAWRAESDERVKAIDDELARLRR